MALSLSLIKGGTFDQAGLYAWKKNYKSKTWMLKYIFSLPGHHYEHIDRPFNRFSSLGATENIQTYLNVNLTFRFAVVG